MKRYVIQFLVAANAVLALALLWMWVDARGALRNSHWTPPAAIKPDFSGAASALARSGNDGVNQFFATLDRPLFSPSRRPPPPVVVAVPPPPDPLANVQLYGVYAGPGGGGIIARVEGKMRRAGIQEKIGEWTIQRIADRDVTFVRGGETRVIRLVRQKGPAAPTSTSQAAPAPAQDPWLQMSGAQRVQAIERERVRSINESNEQNGLPPITNR